MSHNANGTREGANRPGFVSGTYQEEVMKLITLLVLWFQLRALEVTLYGQEEALAVVRDPETINRITLARINCRREWHRVRGRYLELKRSRNVWRIA